MDKNKVLHLNSTFSIKELPKADESIDSIFIEGYASTTDVDRTGDVVLSTAWMKGLDNYLKNPIILAYHDHDDPCGRMVDYKVDSKGLWIKARISAASEVFNLVKDGVLSAFSIGFKVKDAEYDNNLDIFKIKELELVEISVVSVPCNQDTIFSLSKAFDNAADYKSFKEQFAPKGESAKGLESTTEAKSTNKKEWNMDPKELEQLLANAAKSAAEQATKSLLATQKAEEERKAAEAKAQAELEARIKAQVEAQVKTVDTGAERLLQDVEKRLSEATEKQTQVLKGLEEAIKEKAEELTKMQASKMQFADRAAPQGELSYADKEKAVLLGKISGKGLAGTKFGAELVQKYGQHMPSATWELEVSLNMENEVRRRLVVAPLVRAVAMQTNVMTMPLNPEAGLANWVTNDQFGTANSVGGTTATTGQTPGSGSPHRIKEITLNAYKVATREYLNYEEEEDSLLVIMPIVRDAMVRRIARAVDRAYLLGAGEGADPVKGLALYDAASVVLPAVDGPASIANLRGLRKDLGTWGLDPAEVVYVVSTEVYYDLLDDTSFQTMAQVGPQATLLTGQVGQIGNSPVIVSGEFATKAEGAVGAICFAPGNFLAGNQRGLRFDTQELVETQRRVLVASLRTGLTQVTTNLGPGVSALRWGAAA